MRDPAILAKLPAAEREQWQKLWSDVSALIAAGPLAQGRVQSARGHSDRAAAEFTRALASRESDDNHFWFEYAALMLLSGDRPGYVKACADLVDRCGKPGGPQAYHVARACTLSPGAIADATVPGRLAEKELQDNARHSGR